MTTQGTQPERAALPTEGVCAQQRGSTCRDVERDELLDNGRLHGAPGPAVPRWLRVAALVGASVCLCLNVIAAAFAIVVFANGARNTKDSYDSFIVSTLLAIGYSVSLLGAILTIAMLIVHIVKLARSPASMPFRDLMSCCCCCWVYFQMYFLWLFSVFSAVMYFFDYLIDFQPPAAFGVVSCVLQLAYYVFLTVMSCAA